MYTEKKTIKKEYYEKKKMIYIYGFKSFLAHWNKKKVGTMICRNIFMVAFK